MSFPEVPDFESSDQARDVSSRVLHFAQAVIGALGLGTVLYGIGFTAIRAHYWGLGVWPGSLESQEITEEGGRFLFHLFYLPSSLLARVGLAEAAILFLAPAAAAVLLGLRIRAGHWLVRTAAGQLTTRSRLLRVLAIAGAVILSAILLETVWVSLQIEDLLRVRQGWMAAYRSEARRSELYSQIVWRLGAVTAVSVFLWWKFWRAGTDFIVRILVAVQWLLTASGLGAWPMAYGKLVISDLCPVISDPSARPPEEHKLLVRKDGKEYVIWNKPLQRLEIMSVGDKYVLTIGSKEHLLE